MNYQKQNIHIPQPLRYINNRSNLYQLQDTLITPSTLDHLKFIDGAGGKNNSTPNENKYYFTKGK